jgi:thioredoxin reductase (NADPH)
VLFRVGDRRYPLIAVIEGEAAVLDLFEDSALSDLLLWTVMARREGRQGQDGVGAEIVGPHSSEATRQLVEFARRNRLPFTWLDTDRPEHAEGLAQIAGLANNEIPLVRLPGGPELRNPSASDVAQPTRGSAA